MYGSSVRFAVEFLRFAIKATWFDWRIVLSTVFGSLWRLLVGVFVSDVWT